MTVLPYQLDSRDISTARPRAFPREYNYTRNESFAAVRAIKHRVALKIDGTGRTSVVQRADDGRAAGALLVGGLANEVSLQEPVWQYRHAASCKRRQPGSRCCMLVLPLVPKGRLHSPVHSNNRVPKGTLHSPRQAQVGAADPASEIPD